MAGTAAETWELGGTYGNIGVEILAGSRVIAIVHRVQANRLASLKKHPVHDDPQRQRAREVEHLEGSLPVALERARLMASAPAMAEALRQIYWEAGAAEPLGVRAGQLARAALEAAGIPPEGTPERSGG